MLRLIGMVVVIGTTTLMGMQRAERIRSQYAQMQYLQKIIYSIQSEICYARAYLSEIFTEIGIKSEDPYKKWLINLGQSMEERNEESFEKIWKKSIVRYLSGVNLPMQEKERLMYLGNQLGTADVEMQVRVLEVYLQQIKTEMSEMRDSMREKIRLCHCLGVMSGILIAVLLV